MPQNEISDYNETDASNVDITGIDVQENVMRPPAVNNAFRALQGALKRWFKASLFRLRDGTDQTKLLAFDLSGITTATTRTLTVPDESAVIQTRVATTVNNTIPRFDGTTGKQKASTAVVDDAGGLTVTTTTTNGSLFTNASSTSATTLKINNNISNGLEIQTTGSAYASGTRFNVGAGNASFASNNALSIGTIGSANLNFYTNNTYRGGWTGSTGYFLVGAANSAFATVEAGLLLDPAGYITSKKAGTASQVHIEFGNNAAVTPASVGSISTNGSATSYNTSSDGRLKPLREDFDAGAIIDALEPVYHNWKDFPDQWSYGLIAQDAAKIVPSAVNVGRGEPGEEGFMPWSVDYSKLVPILIREIQDLRLRLSVGGL